MRQDTEGAQKVPGLWSASTSISCYYYCLLGMEQLSICCPLALETSMRRGVYTHTHLHAHTHARVIFGNPAPSLSRSRTPGVGGSSASPHTPPPVPDCPLLFSTELFTFSHLPFFKSF